MLFLKQPLILPFYCYKSVTTRQIDSNKVSNSKLKPGLCNYAKSGITEPMTPPQQPHKRGTIIFGHPIESAKYSVKELKSYHIYHCHLI